MLVRKESWCGTLPMIISCGLYYDVPGLRELCHAVKRRNKDAMYDAADSLSVLVKKYNLEGCNIIPIPNHSGRAEYTLEILNYLKQRCNIRVCDILLGSAHATQYDTKKAGSSLSLYDLGFALNGKIPSGRVVLFDNVIGTGTTYFSAMLTISEQ